MQDKRTIAGAAGRVVEIRQFPGRHFVVAKRKHFLDALAATCNVMSSARQAGVGIGTCYRWKARDATFAHAWETALSMGYARLEDALLGYAVMRAEAAGTDSAAVDAAGTEDHVHADPARGPVTRSDLNFALAVLNRHRANAGTRNVAGAGDRRASREETDVALRRKLDSLARRLRDT